jgi:amino acid adenylation domain-containing protein/non-ribosomal peptide synthase protein (TIGR01720 family)
MAQLLNPAGRSLFLSQCVELAGPVDAESFRTAVRQVFAECDALRLRILVGSDGFRQEVVARDDIDLPLIDVSGASDPEQAAGTWMRTDLARPADLTGNELFTSSLLKLSPNRFVWYQRCHHVILDGYSSWLIAQRVAAVYTALAGKSPRPKPSFGTLRALIEEEAAYRSSAAFERDKAYWNARFRDRPEAAGLSEPPAIPSDEVVRGTCTLPQEAVGILSAAAGYSGQGWPGIVIAAVAAYLHRVTGAVDVILGMPVTGRRTPVSLRTPGMLANVLPLRLDVRPGMSIVDLAHAAARETGQLLRHQRYSHESLRTDLGIIDTGGRLYGPEVNILSLDQTLDFAGTRAALSNVTNGPVEDISLYAYRDPNENTLHIDFAGNPRCHSEADVAAHAARFAHFFGALTAHAGEPLGGIDILRPAERQRVLIDWNDTERQEDYQDVIERIRAVATSSPASVAVVDDQQRIDYATLVSRSSALSRRLAAVGVRPGALNAVLTGRSARVAVAMLGIWGAGAGYVPLDVKAPVAETVSLLECSGARVLIVDAEHERVACEIAGAIGAHIDIVVLDEAADATGALFPVVAAGGNIAGVYFTSRADSCCLRAGSCGRPKGIMTHRRGMLNHLQAKAGDLGLTAADSVVHNAPLTSGASVWQMIAPLLTGGSARVVDDATAADPFALFSLVAHEGLTVLQAEPFFLRAALSLWDDAAASASPPAVPSLRWIILPAHALQPEICVRWFDVCPHVSVVIADGPAECSGDISHAVITKGSPFGAETVTLGRPVRNTRLYVLDDALRPVPIGMPGELYVGGAGVGWGYLDDPRRTCTGYIPDPFQPGTGARMFRTRQRVRYLPDGQLGRLGRYGRQVEIRGQRVDLGEVEGALRTAPGVREAAVSAQTGTASQQVLIGYVAGPADVSTVRAHVASLLPDHAVPAALILLGALPRNDNGDVDMEALPKADVAWASANRAPRSREEKILCGVFAQVLGTSDVGVGDSFFTLGGDSILSVQAVSHARQAGLTITPRDVFQLKTPEALALAATRATFAGRGGDRLDGGAGVVPATPAMHWLREIGGPIDGFHQSVVVNVPAELGQARLTGAVQALLDRHDMLRATLVRSADGRVWGLRVPHAGEVRAERCVRRVDVCGQNEDERRSALEAEFTAARARLAPGAGEMMQVVWFDNGPERLGQLLLTVHHLVVDGVSWRILLPDLSAAWQSAATGGEAVPDRMGTPFLRWSEGLLIAAQDPRWADSLAVWTRMLEVPVPLIGNRPLDRNVDVAGRARSITVNLTARQTAALLTEVTAAFTASVQDVLLTCLAMAIGDQCGGHSVLIDLEGHGREDILDGADVTRTIGWFTNVFPVRIDLAGKEAGKETVPGEFAARLLKRVKEQVRDLPAGGVGYGLLRYLNPVTRPVLAALPTPEVCFNYLGRFLAAHGDDGEPWLPRVESAALASPGPDVPFAHTLEVVATTLIHPGGPRLLMTLTWPEAAMEASDVQRIADAWITILEALTEHVVARGAGGLTPSDLPLITLSQAEIEEFEEQY